MRFSDIYFFFHNSNPSRPLPQRLNYIFEFGFHFAEKIFEFLIAYCGVRSLTPWTLQNRKLCWSLVALKDLKYKK